MFHEDFTVTLRFIKLKTSKKELKKKKNVQKRKENRTEICYLLISGRGESKR